MSDNSTHEIEVECAWCHAHMDRSTGVTNDQPPVPGSLTVCAGCGGINEFNAELQLQQVSEEKMKEIAAQDIHAYVQLRQLQAFFREEAIILLRQKEK